MVLRAPPSAPAVNQLLTGPERLALVTGASSGIGAAVAQLLSYHGLRVILVARRPERLADLQARIQNSGGKAVTIPTDLSLESQRHQLFDTVTQNYGEVDILVNNAGLGWYGFMSEMPWMVARHILQVNVEAVVHLSLLFLQSMKARNSGHIINIGSISGSLPSQGVAVYGATKSFLDNLSSALHRELYGSRVHITVVRAGPVRTDFCQAAASQDAGLPVPTERIGVTPEVVANHIWKVIQHPRKVIYIPA